MRRSDIDAGQGQVFTVTEVEPGVFQSVFPSWLHWKSQLHDSEAAAWAYIDDVRKPLLRRTLTVTGNYGDITVDWDTGRVLDYSPDPNDAPEYADIFWFHVEEFRRYYGYDGPDGWERFLGNSAIGQVDILGIGFWASTVTLYEGHLNAYFPPAEDRRQELREAHPEVC